MRKARLISIFLFYINIIVITSKLLKYVEGYYIIKRNKIVNTEYREYVVELDIKGFLRKFYMN